MRKLFFALCAFVNACLVSQLQAAPPDANLAMNDPDQQSWELFMTVNADASSSGNNYALFETWASDTDTFNSNPVWPSTPHPGTKSAPRVLGFHQQGIRPLVVPGGSDGTGEETRRNKPDFDFIVQNNLYKVSGLVAAFASGKALVFPQDSVEVKANWVRVDKLHDYNGYSGTVTDAGTIYHISTASDGNKYALVSFHIISKLVPNWTWATFEHKDNPGRCDVIGCKDTFGAQVAAIPPLSFIESTDRHNGVTPTHYPDCQKSAAVLTLFASVRIDQAFKNYCLKGSQTDFEGPDGLAIRLGNSVTEATFVANASCMSCHGRAGFDAQGSSVGNFAGFDLLYAQFTGGDLGNPPLGALDERWFWENVGSPPNTPNVADRAGTSNMKRRMLPADFVWSIPFCAINDTAVPPQSKSAECSGK